jgi:hypothetical protein
MVIEEPHQWRQTKVVTDGVVESVVEQRPLQKDEEENKKEEEREVRTD